MENKLQQLTQKLYDEGLEKGRAEAERLVSEAKGEAAGIIAAAKAEAEAIVRAAEARAEDTAKNSMTEIALAGKQAVARIKEEISSLIAAESTFSAVKAANLDPAFVKEMLLSVARNWNGASSSKVELQALLPEAQRATFDAAFAAAAKELLDAGIEVGYSQEVRTGFRVGAGRQLLHLLLGRRFRGAAQGVPAQQGRRTAVQSLTRPCSRPTITVWWPACANTRSTAARRASTRMPSSKRSWPN